MKSEESWELINTEGLNEGSIFWKVGETTDILFYSKEGNFKALHGALAVIKFKSVYGNIKRWNRNKD